MYITSETPPLAVFVLKCEGRWRVWSHRRRNSARCGFSPGLPYRFSASLAGFKSTGSGIDLLIFATACSDSSGTGADGRRLAWRACSERPSQASYSRSSSPAPFSISFPTRPDARIRTRSSSRPRSGGISTTYYQPALPDGTRALTSQISEPPQSRVVAQPPHVAPPAVATVGDAGGNGNGDSVLPSNGGHVASTSS